MTNHTSTESTAAADASGVPAGYTTLTPFLAVDGAERAIEFYCAVFGATLVTRMDGPDGKVAHAELDFGSGRLQLSDPAPQIGLDAPDGGGNVTHSIAFYCADVDAAYRRALEAGATAIGEPADFFTGDRYGTIMDPFGHRWVIQTRVEDVRPEEVERRVKEWLAAQG